MEKIWNVTGNKPNVRANPEVILNEYAKQLSEDTNQTFRGLVTRVFREDTGDVTYALYIVTPGLKDYMYRLLEININNLLKYYPLELKLFAKDPKNHQFTVCDNEIQLRKKLVEFIKSPITSGILMHLQTLADIQKSYE